MATKRELKQKYRGRIATIAFALGIEDTMGKKPKQLVGEILDSIRNLTQNKFTPPEEVAVVSRTTWFKADKKVKKNAKKIAKRQEKKQTKKNEQRPLLRATKSFDKPCQINADFISDDSHLEVQNLNSIITALKAENKDLKGQVKEYFDLSVSLKEELKYERSEQKKRWDEFVPGSMK